MGEGATVASDGKTLISADGLRQYRPPSFKPNLGKVQANFENGRQTAIWTSSEHMQAELKRLHSPDVLDLPSFMPQSRDNFGFLLQAMIGPKGLDGEESFGIQVCTPKWLLEQHDRADVVSGRHFLIIFEYNYERLVRFISDFCDECIGKTWQEIAGQLSRLGQWEFEDYQA